MRGRPRGWHLLALAAAPADNAAVERLRDPLGALVQTTQGREQHREHMGESLGEVVGQSACAIHLARSWKRRPCSAKRILWWPRKTTSTHRSPAVMR